MAYDTRLLNDPLLTGYVVREKIKCGKKNCKCYTKSIPHTAYYLHYREYKPIIQDKKRTDYVAIKKKKYIKKTDVEKIRKEIAMAKAPFIIDKIPLHLVNASTKNHHCQDNLFADLYKKYLKYVWKH